MNIIKLTTMDNRPIYVNMDLVQHFSQRHMDREYIDGCNIVFRDPDTLINVAESAEQIYDILSPVEEEQQQEG